MDCKKDIYSRLDTLRDSPGFIDRASGSPDPCSPEYVAYCEILSGLKPYERKYYLSRGRRQEAQRRAYTRHLSRKPRHYTRGSTVGGSTAVDVSRSDFPPGPEGAIEYRKAYSRERYRLSRGKGPCSPGYTVSEKVLAARKTRRTRWDTDEGRAVKQRAAMRREERARAVSLRKDIVMAMRSYLTGPSIVLWTVQGGGKNLRDVQRNEAEEGTLSEGTWTLDSFYSALRDGTVKMLLGAEPPLRPLLGAGPCTEGGGAVNLLRRIHEAISDSVVLVDMYNSGEELPDDVRGEINLLRTERSEILKILSGIRRGVKEDIVGILCKRREAGLPLDLDSCLRPLCILHLLTSAINAANWSERRGLYLYYKCHKFQMYRRRVKVERHKEDEARREQFRRLDKKLGTDRGASEMYWKGGPGGGPSV